MRARYAQQIEWMQPNRAKGTFNSITDDWSGTRTSERAVVSATVGQAAAAQYGNDLQSMLTLTLNRSSEIAVRCGVWLDDTQTAVPWGVVLSVRKYPLHIEADVQRLVMRS